MTDAGGIEVAHGLDCVVLMRQRDGRRWAEVMRLDEADELANAIREQATAVRAATLDVAPAPWEPPPPP